MSKKRNASKVEQRIWKLMDGIKAKFPERKARAEALMAKHGPFDPIEMHLSPPEKLSLVPTFSAKSGYPLSPMLAARFRYAGSWDDGLYHWLELSEMRKWMKKRDIRVHHRARRSDFSGSAPMLFPDKQLTLFGVVDELPEYAIYLVWSEHTEEPEIWSHMSEFEKFENLEDYFMWYLKRK